MDPNAFRKTSPITHFTPEELGMNTAGTIFEQNGARGDISDSSPSSMKDEPPIGAYPVTHDPETASPMDQGLYLHAEDEGPRLELEPGCEQHSRHPTTAGLKSVPDKRRPC